MFEYFLKFRKVLQIFEKNFPEFKFTWNNLKNVPENNKTDEIS